MAMSPRSSVVSNYHVFALVFLLATPSLTYGQQQLITNGGFDQNSGNYGTTWSSSGCGFTPPACNAINPRSASYYACFSNASGIWINNCSGNLWQSFTVPSNATSAVLTFYYRVGTTRTGGSAVDNFYVRIFRTDTNQMISEWHYTNLNGVPPGSLSAWAQVVDSSTLMSYRGLPLSMNFFGSTGPVGAGGVSTIHIDDISVVSTVPPPQSQQYTLTLSSNPSGGGSTDPNPPPTNGTYTAGTVVQLTANANPGYQFSSWSGDVSGTSNPTSITMNGNRSASANFGVIPPQQYTLSLTPSPSNGGSVSGSPPPTNGTYTAGTVVQLTANANPGYQFSSWSGDASGTSNPTSITMNGNRSASANFGVIPPQQYTLSLTPSPSNGGSVSGSPPPTNGTYTAGTVVQLTANANSGYQFSSWSGNASGTGNPTSITMNGNRSVSANFGVVLPPGVIRLRVPWDKAGDVNPAVAASQFWVPQTYDTHTTSRGPHYAVDFRYASPQAPGVACPQGSNSCYNDAASRDKNVRAMHDGMVTTENYNCAGANPPCTYLIITKDDGSVASRYIHMRINPNVVGQRVSAGDLIGWVSNLGQATTPHLMVYIYRGSLPVLSAAVDLSDPSGALLDGEVIMSGNVSMRDSGDLAIGMIYTYSAMPRSSGGGADSDSDGDGVPDDLDSCPDTAAGETVDAQGCSSAQLDGTTPGTNPAPSVCGASACGAVGTPMLTITLLGVGWIQRRYRRGQTSFGIGKTQNRR